MSKKNLTRGQQIKVTHLTHNLGMSREDAVNNAIANKGEDQPRALPSRSKPDQLHLGNPDPFQDWADQESDY
jgi:hypothetical protein